MKKYIIKFIMFIVLFFALRSLTALDNTNEKIDCEQCCTHEGIQSAACCDQCNGCKGYQPGQMECSDIPK